MHEHYLDIINSVPPGLIKNNNPLIVRDLMEMFVISEELFPNEDHLQIVQMTTYEVIETFFLKKGYFDISYFVQYTSNPQQEIEKTVSEVIVNLDLNNTNGSINIQDSEKSNTMELTTDSSLDTSITANTTETSVNSLVEQLSMSNVNLETLEFTPKILEPFFAPTFAQMFFDLFIFFVVVCSNFILKVFTDSAILTSTFELIKSLFK